MNMEPLVPHVLLEDEDYKVFLDLVSIIHDDIKDLISKFPELVDIDNAPEVFLPKLSALIRYKYRHDIDEDIQREIIKRIISIYKDRGTDDAISMAATYGDDPNWIGSHVFLPGAEINRDKAIVTHPVDEIFKHDISRHSGTHRFADATRWTAGTLLIKVPYLNDQIRESIKKVVPAGLRVYYDLVNNSSGDGQYNELAFGEWVLDTNYEIDYQMIVKDRLETAIYSVRNRPGVRRLRSGRQMIFIGYDLDYASSFSMLPIEDSEVQTNITLKDTKVTDLVKTENKQGQIIYKQLQNLTYKDSVRINRNGYSYITNVLLLLLDDEIYIDNTQVEGAIIASTIIHNIDYEIPGVELLKRHSGLPARSTSKAIRSGKYAYDGTYTGEIFMIAELEDVVPSDRWYPVAAVANLKPGEYLKDYAVPVEVKSEIYLGAKSLGDVKLSDLVQTTYDTEELGSTKNQLLVEGSGEINLMDLKLNQLVEAYQINMT